MFDRLSILKRDIHDNVSLSLVLIVHSFSFMLKEWSSSGTIFFVVICQLDERSTLIMRYIKQSTPDDMSGNWNGEILDMDEGKAIELFA